MPREIFLLVVKCILPYYHMFVKVNALTNQKKEFVKKTSENRYEISVKEKPERNNANNRIIQLLAIHFKITEKKIRIINGHHTPSKLISIDIEENSM